MPEVFAGSAAYPAPSPRPVLSMGNFDGVHLGHRHLLDRLVTRARAMNRPACVYTFDPPPRVVLAPHQHQPRVLAWTDKVRLLGELGVDQVVVERFTRSFAQHPPEWFAREILGRRLQPTAIVVGYDFRFGRGRAGDVDMLRKLLPNIEVAQVDAWALEQAVVSSSAIRDAVRAGRVSDAAVLLGRAHCVRGTVMAGDQRGRTIGFPTANLETDAELVPEAGVYTVTARVDGGDWLQGVANLGVRPTFDGRRFLIEVHLLDFSGDLYGREMEVAFLDRLRSEEKFDDVDALVTQIRADVAEARVRFAEMDDRE